MTHDNNEILRPGQKVPARRVLMSLLSRALTVLVIIVAVGAVASIAIIRINGLRLQTVTSGSMQPTFSAGDVAITMPIPVSSLVVGDVLAFYPPGQGVPVLHRVTSFDGSTITTRGDANRVEDPWHATLQGPTAYRLIAIVPFIGWLTEWRPVLLIGAGFLVALTIFMEIRKEKTILIRSTFA